MGDVKGRFYYKMVFLKYLPKELYIYIVRLFGKKSQFSTNSKLEFLILEKISRLLNISHCFVYLVVSIQPA